MNASVSKNKSSSSDTARKVPVVRRDSREQFVARRMHHAEPAGSAVSRILKSISSAAKLGVSALALAAVSPPQASWAIEWSSNRTVTSDVDYPGDGLIINNGATINITNNAIVRAYDLSIQGGSTVNINSGSFMTNYNSWSLIRNNATVTVANGASLRSNQYVKVTGDSYALGGTLIVNGGGAIRRNDGSSRHVVELGNGGTLVLGNATSTAPMLQYFDGNTFYSTGGWIVSDGWNSNVVVNMAGSYSIPSIRPYQDLKGNMSVVSLTVQSGNAVFDQPNNWAGTLRTITVSGGSLEMVDPLQQPQSGLAFGSTTLSAGTTLILNNNDTTYLDGVTGAGGVDVRGTTVARATNPTYSGFGNARVASYTGDTRLFDTAQLVVEPFSNVATTVTQSSVGSSISLTSSSLKGVYGQGQLALSGATLTTQSNHGGAVSINGSATFSSGTHRFSGTLTAAATSDVSVTNGGTLAAAGNIDLSSLSSVTLVGASALDVSELTGTVSLKRLIGSSATGAVRLGAGGLVVNNAQSGDRFSGVISGAAGLTVNGGSDKALELGGVNTYSGGTTVHNGATLKLVTSGSIAASSQVYIYSSGTLDISGVSGATSSIRDLRGTVNGNIVLGSKTLRITNATDTDYYNGTLSGTGGLRISGGTQKMGADLSYTGATTVDAGAVLWLGNGGTTGSIVNGATVNGELVIDRGNSYDLTAARTISGTGILSKLGTGELLVRAAQGYTGATNIRNGSIVILDDGSLAQSSTINIEASGTFDLSRSNNGATIQALSGAGTVIFGSQNGQRGMTITAGGVFGGSITGYGDLRITGGNQTLTGDNTFVGTVYLGGSGNGNLTIGSASIANQGSLANANVETGTSGRLIFMRPDANGIFGGRVQGSGGITQAGTGTTTLTGDANTYTGDTVISAGTLRLSGASSLDRSSGVSIAAAGTFDISAINGATTVKKVSGSGVVNLAGKTLTLSEQNGAFGGRFTGVGGNLVLAGPQLAISQDSDFTGSLTINSGSSLVATGAASLSGASNLVISGTLDVSGLNAATPTFVATSVSGSGGRIILGTKGLNITAGRPVDDFGGVIQGSGAVNILGGTQILSGSNTYSGATSIGNGAVLSIAGGGSVGNSSGVTIGQTGTFDISGTAGGALPGTAVQAIAGSGTVQLGLTAGTARTLSITSSGTYGGVIAGYGDLRVSGSGVQTLTGDSTFIGTVRVASGSIRIGNGGTTGALLNANVEVQSGQQVIFQRSDALGTFGGQVTGAGELVQLGTGTTTLGNASTYTGATRVQAGRLALGTTGDISGSSNVIITGGATFDISATSAGSAIKQITSTGAGTASILLGSKTLSLTQQNATFGGTISGSGGLTLGSFSQLLALTGANTYTGATTVSSGTLSLTGAGSIAASSGVTVDATLDISGHTGNAVIASLAGSNTAGRVILGSNTLEVANSAGTFSGVISGSGGLLLRGGNLTLTNANTYTGLTTIASGGYLVLGNGGISGEVQGNIAFSGAGELRINRSNAVTFTNAISGAGSVVQQGTGSTTFTTAQGYTGTTRISSGSLRLEGGGSIASSSDVVADANFNVSQVTSPTVSIRSLSGGASGTVTLGDRNLVLSSSSGVFAGVIGGAGGQLTIASGTLTLSGANTYSGQTAVQSGASLQIGAGGTTGAIASTSVLNDGTLIFARSNTLSYTGSISGTGVLRQTGAGTTVLTGAVAAGGGIQVNAGTLSIEGGNAFSGNVNVAAGATMQFAKSQEFVYGGQISGSGRLSQVGSGASGKLILTGANAFTGGTTIGNGAILQIGSNAAGGGTTGSLTGNIANAGTLIVNRSNSVALAGSISGAGGFVQNGSGKTTLSGASTYTGATQVNAGELAVNGSLGATNVVVANGAILSGTGTIGGNVDVSGALNPGQSPGTMTVQGNLTLQASSVSNFELGEAGVVGGANNDLVIVNGALALNGTLNVTASNAGYYRLFNAGNGITGSFQTVNLLGGVAGSSATVYTDTPGSNGLATQVNIRLLDANQRVQDWDGNRYTGGAQAQGGSGIWNATNTNWLAPGSAISGAWGGSIGHFGGSAGTVTISGTIGFSELSFDVDGYILQASAGSALQLSSNGSTQTSSIVNVVGGASVTIAAEMVNGDLTSLTKVGSGRMILTADNSFTGDTYVTGGSLQLGDNGAANTGSVAGNIANSGEVIFYRSGPMSYGGVISGGIEPDEGGIVTLAGTSDVTLTGVNTYTGVTNINAGSLHLAGLGSISGSSKVVVGTGTFDISQRDDWGTSIRSLAGAGTVLLGDKTLAVTSAADTYGGVLSGTGGLTLQAGTLVLNNANTFTGDTLLTGGVLRLTDFTPAGDLTRVGTLAGRIITGVGVDAGRLVLDYSSAVEPVLGNAIAGTGTLEKQGAGIVSLTGDATHTGGTLIRGGALRIGASGTSGSLAGNVDTGDGSGAGRLEFWRSNDYVFSGDVSGTGILSQNGGGRTVLTGNAVHSGGTQILNGTLAVGNGGATGSLAGNVSTSNGTTLVFNRDNTATLAFAGVVSGAGNLRQEGSGRTLLGASSTYTGTTEVAAGTLALSGSGSIAQSSILTVGDAATFDISSADNGASVRRLSGAGSVVLGDRNLTIAQAAADIFSGVISGSGAVSLTGGIQSLTGANTYTGLTSIASGAMLAIGGAEGAVAGDIANNGNLTFDHEGGIHNYTGSVSGAGNLWKLNDGTLVLSGNSNYSGQTNVLGGTLQVTGSLSGTTVAVGAGATLAGGAQYDGDGLAISGTGIIDGPVTIQNGGVLNAGSDLRMSSLTLQAGSTTNFAVATPDVASSALNSRVIVANDLFLGGTLNVSVARSGYYRLFSAGSILGDFAEINVGSSSPDQIIRDYNVYKEGDNPVTELNIIVLGDDEVRQYWNGPRMTAGALVGGTGTWNSENTNWLSPDFASVAPWVGSFAIFDGTAGTVTVEGTQQFDRMQFKTDGYALVAGPDAQLQLNNLGMIIVDGQRTATVAVSLVDGTSEGLTKTGSGILNLSANNSYTGTTVVEAGSLSLTGAGSIATSSEVQVGVDGTFNIGGIDQATAAIKGLSGAGTVTLGTRTLQLTEGTHVFGGTISGGGGIDVLGGSHTLTGDNTFNGIARVTHGTLAVTNINSLSRASYVALDNADSVLDISGAANGVAINSLAGSGQVQLGAGNLTVVNGSWAGMSSGIFGGSISGSGSVNLLGGTLVLSGNNTYTGTTTVTANGTLDIGGGTTQGSLAGNIVNDGTLDFNYASGEHAFAGVISGNGTVNIRGAAAATVNLAGANSFSGETIVHNGTLRLVGDGSVSSSSLVRIGSTAGFDISGIGSDSTTIKGLAGAGTVTLGSRSLGLVGGDSTYYGSINGTNQSVLALVDSKLQALGSINDTLVLIENGASLQVGNGQNFGSLNSNVVNQGELLFDRSDAVSFDHAISGSGSLVKRGGGVLSLNVQNDFSGTTTVVGGTLRLASQGTLDGDIINNAAVQFARADAWTYGGDMSGFGILTISSAPTSVTGNLAHTGGTMIESGALQIGTGGSNGSISGPIVNNAELLFNRGDTLVYNGSISGVGSVTQLGTGTTILTGTQTYSGGTTIVAGSLQLGDGTLSAAIQGDVLNDGTLVFKQGAASVFSGLISGSGNLVQQGPGSVTLTADNTYTGATVIAEGSALQVGNGGSTGRISNTVLNNGALSFAYGSDVTYDGVIAGSGSLRQAGTATLNLTAAQEYTGTTDVDAGATLKLTGDGSIAGTSKLALRGSFDIGGISADVSRIGDLSGTGSVRLGTKTLVLSDAGSVFEGVIEGSGGIEIAAGAMNLLASQTFTGQTTIASGAGLALGGDGSLSESSRIVVDGGLSIAGTSAGAVVKSISGGQSGLITLGDRTLTINAAADTYAGMISGDGGLTVSGGTLVLTGANRYRGTTTIASGATLDLRANPASGQAGDFMVDGDLKLGIGSGLVFAYDSTLSGTGAITKTGAGQLIISQASDSIDFMGDALVSEGTFTVNGRIGGNVTAVTAGTLSGSGFIAGDVIIGSGGTLSAGNSPGTLTINGNLSLASGSTSAFELGQASIVGGPANDHVIVNGALSVNGTLNAAVRSIGYYRLFDAASINGTFNTVNVSGLSGAIDTAVYVNNPGPATVMNLSVLGQGDHLQFWDGADTVGDNQVVGGNGIWSTGGTNWTDAFGNIQGSWLSSLAVFGGNAGRVEIDGEQSVSALQFDVDGYTLDEASSGGRLLLAASSASAQAHINVAAGSSATIAATLADGTTGSLVKGFGGTLVLSAVNTYSGNTTIAGGTLALAGIGSISNSNGVIVGENSVFDISATQAPAVQIKRLGGQGSVVLGNHTLVIASQDTNAEGFDGVFGGVMSGTGGLVLSSGNLTLTGVNSFTGTTAVASGASLQIGSGNLAGMIAGDLVTDGTTTFNTVSGLQSFAGAISGNGVLVKAGEGILNLTGNSAAFSGSVDVAGGKLAVNGTLGGTVVVQNSGILGGSGTINGATTVLSGGTLSAGNSPGTLTINGGLTLAAGSTSQFELGQRGIVGGQSNDLVIVNGALIYGGTLDITAASAGFYRLFEAQSVSGGFDAVNVTIGGTTASGQVYVNAPGAAATVNLAVLKAGQNMLFWDGADTLGDGSVDGGAGTWSAEHTNWTSGPGEAEVNGPWGSSVGVFSGTGGTITVVGQQTFDTLQFTADGYNLQPGTDGSLNFNDATGGTINVASGITTSIATPITGSSSHGFVKTGAGALILTGDSTYAGGTTIDAGTLQVGAGGTTGSIIGNIVNNASLVADRSDMLRLDGSITGNGSFTNNGGGTTLLTADNTYTGGTTINNGAVQLGAGGTSGSLTGAVAIGNAGSLVINRSNDFTLVADLSGNGNLRQIGPNVTTLQGNSCAFTGTTTVTNGKLLVNGCLGGTVIVENGGSFGGDGTVGGGSGGSGTDDPGSGGTVTIGNGGTFSPGGDDTVGNTTVASNLTIKSGSIYVVNVNAAGQSDHTHVKGVATITGGSVQVRAANGDYQPITRYTIITADGGVERGGPNLGFDTVTSNLAFLTPALDYDPNHVYLTMTRNNVSFDTVSQTPNQSEVGRAVEYLQPGNPVYDAVVGLDGDSARKAFNDLSGEIHPTLLGRGVEVSLVLQDAVSNRLRAAAGRAGAQATPTLSAGFVPATDPKDQGAVIWGSIHGTLDSTRSDGNAGGADWKSGGITNGFDTQIDGGMFDGWRFGGVARYEMGSLSVPDRSSSAEADIYSLGVYGGGNAGAVDVNLGALYTLMDVDTTRDVNIGALSNRLESDYTLGVTHIFGEVAYQMMLDDVAIEPFAGLAYVHAQNRSFSESGGAAALTSTGDGFSVPFATLGIRTQKTFAIDGGIDITAKGTVGWRHAFNDVPKSALSFAGQSAFDVQGLPIGSDELLIEIGVETRLSENINLGVSYSGQFSSSSSQNTGKLTLDWKF